MSSTVAQPAGTMKVRRKTPNLKRYWTLYLMVLAPVVYFLVFRYMPLVNAQIAFKDFSPLDGVWKSPWVGFKNFLEFFSSIYFWELMRNTVGYSLAKLLIGLPLAVILALALSETCAKAFKGVVQTMTYLPHFLSWVIMYGVLLALLSEGDGWVNMIIKATGGETKSFLGSPNWFPVIVVLSDAWKETGWSAIIYLAALAGIDPALYEAAEVEGASRLQRIRYISLPGIVDVIVVVTLLRLGTVLDAGFHQLFMLYSMPVMSVGDILDTWVYRQGILDFRFSLATAVGLFKGVIGLLMVLVFNKLAKKFSGSSLY